MEPSAASLSKIDRACSSTLMAKVEETADAVRTRRAL
jgi:hypothetical protein